VAQINLANLEIRISLLTLVLMNCSHRSTKIDVDSQLQKLRDFINPVQQLWQNPQMGEAISSFGGFCELLGLGKVSDYLVSRRVHEIKDWGLYQLDAEGQAIQKDLDDRVKVDKA
jgi:exportin-5